MSAGSATAGITLEQRADTLRTAVLVVTYRAPKAAKLRLSWTTRAVFGSGCGGVALQAATLR